jgi:hypothetical protein
MTNSYPQKPMINLMCGGSLWLPATIAIGHWSHSWANSKLPPSMRLSRIFPPKSSTPSKPLFRVLRRL